MEKLNKIEIEILQEIIKENRVMYPFLEMHLQYLHVKNRDYTGVGIYTYFLYSKEFEKNNINTLLSSAKDLTVTGLENELSYVLDITNGKANFLEIVTNGEDTLERGLINFKLD